MKLRINKGFSGELNFQKLNFKNSIFRFNEKNEAFTVAEDLDFTPEEISEFVKFATLPQDEIESVEGTPLDRIFSLRFRAKVLCAIARFNSTFIAYRQLGEFLSMSDNKAVSDRALKSSIEKLRSEGFIEVVKVRQEGIKNDVLALYKLSSSRVRDGSLFRILSSKLDKSELDELELTSGLQLNADEVLQNNIISSIIVEMFKAGFITEAFLPGKSESGELFKIRSFVSVKAPGDTDKKLFLFAPRNTPGFEEKLKASIKAFAEEHKGDQTLPKLLLCCEDADMIFDVNDLLADLGDDVQIIFTDDLSLANDFSNAFSLFDENGTELQLAPLPADQKTAVKNGGRSGGRRRSQGNGQSKQQ